VTLAALEALLALYTNPDQLVQRVPALRLLTRTPDDISSCANTIEQAVAPSLGDHASVEVLPCHSQVGSGAQPSETLPSFALALKPRSQSRGSLNKLAAAFRQLPIPVIGRLHEDSLWLDMRCLEDTEGFINNLKSLSL